MFFSSFASLKKGKKKISITIALIDSFSDDFSKRFFEEFCWFCMMTLMCTRDINKVRVLTC